MSDAKKVSEAINNEFRIAERSRWAFRRWLLAAFFWGYLATAFGLKFCEAMRYQQ